MSDPSLFVSPLARRAARNLHIVEWLSGNDTWRFNWLYRWNFWRIRRMMAMTPDEAAAWLPALALAVTVNCGGLDTGVLAEFSWRLLPEPLPPEAVAWRDRLIQVWEEYLAITTRENSLRLSALVRLDRRAERLPEWLREARRALDLAPEDRRLRLAALAGWRSRPGDRPASGDIRKAVSQWGQFWKRLYRDPGSHLNGNGLIAATALLHLAEAGWLPSGPSPEQLREEFRQRVQQWFVSTYRDLEILQILLFSVSAPEQRQDIMAWLELTRQHVDWEKRGAVWEMLVSWQRKGILERGGISLVPDLARALEREADGGALLAMAGYVPEAAEASAHPEAARAVVARWEALSRNDDWEIRQAAWVARWNLRRAGVLTAEEQGRFGADYVEAIGSEDNREVLLALAQITPPGTFPLATWAGRLSDQNDRRRLAAHLAIHGWLVEMAGGGQHRQVRQALRRAGQEVTGTVAPFVNLPHNVLPDFRRLHEIETALAAGHLPPSPDADIENQPMSRAGLARLPESHPRGGRGPAGGKAIAP